MTVNELQVPTTHAATPAPNMNYYAAEQLKWLSDDLSTILNNSEDTDRNKKSLVKAIDEVRFIRELLYADTLDRQTAAFNTHSSLQMEDHVWLEDDEDIPFRVYRGDTVEVYTPQQLEEENYGLTVEAVVDALDTLHHTMTLRITVGGKNLIEDDKDFTWQMPTTYNAGVVRVVNNKLKYNK